MFPVVLNRRYGHATNSSSSHSIVWLPKGHDCYDQDNTPGDQTYGWENFFLLDPMSKAPYVAQMLSGYWTEEMATKYGVEYNEDGYIDHESAGMPSGAAANIEKFVELLITNDDIAIVGGNDNSSGEFDDIKKKHEFDFSMLFDTRYRRRWDGVVMVVYNPSNGTKMRFSFDENEEYKVASAPELVDVKITDYCPYACDYCYQDSTRDGQHGDLGFIKSTIDQFVDKGVFELALGGGETTMHPQFEEILYYSFMKGITPNFTTRNLSWLRQDDKRKRIFSMIGAFAYSADTAKEVQEFADLRSGMTWGEKEKFSVQIVMGTVDREEFQKILDICDKHSLRLTLLGYKIVGRGDQVQPTNYDWWMDEVKERVYTDWDGTECTNFGLGIDTELACQYKNQLAAHGIHDDLYTLTEGTHSCYVDAVKQTIAPSSYEADMAQYKPFDENWQKTFQTFASAKVNAIEVLNI